MQRWGKVSRQSTECAKQMNLVYYELFWSLLTVDPVFSSVKRSIDADCAFLIHSFCKNTRLNFAQNL